MRPDPGLLLIALAVVGLASELLPADCWLARALASLCDTCGEDEASK